MWARFLLVALPDRVRLALRIAIGVVFGVPITVVLGIPSLASVVIGLPTALVALITDVEVPQGLVWVSLWGAAGGAGLVGFWWWVFSPRPITGQRAGLVAMLITIGVVAMLPIALGNLVDATVSSTNFVGAGAVVLGVGVATRHWGRWLQGRSGGDSAQDA